MPRRTVTLTIDRPKDGERENRDAGKSFLITEVSAVEAEEWGLRAFRALGTSGIIVPQEMADAGLLGVMIIGYQALMGASEQSVLPLWREMLPACVQYKPPVGEDQQGHTILMPWSPILVEEVSTLIALRKQIVELHTGFTLAELVQLLRQGSASKEKTSPTTLTSLESSEQS